MLNWLVIFLLLALVAAVLGFTSIVGVTIGAAKIACYVFLALFVLSLIRYLFRGAS